VRRRLRSSEFFLTVGFLALLGGVPLAQIVLELWRGQHVQFTDVFRGTPTLPNLRRYESALENQSWVRQVVRPAVQRALFLGLKDAGAKGLLGTDGWLFYRPGVRYLVEGDRPDTPELSSFCLDLSGCAKTVLPTRCAALVEQTVPEIRFDMVRPGPLAGRRQAALEAIAQYRRQLKDRGIELLVMPVPEKSSVYPDHLTGRADVPAVRSPTEDLLDELRREGIDVIDLFVLFRQARAKTANGATSDRYYLAADTHWTPEGAWLAAQAVAERIRQRGWLPESPRKYQSTSIQVQRRGDIVQMVQVSGIDRCFPLETVTCSQVTERIVGLLTPRSGDREGTFANTHLKDTPLEPTVLLLGDSFSRIYQLPEPKSLGEMHGPGGTGDLDQASQAKSTKRLLPGSAGLPSLLAAALQSPVDYIVSDGGAATEVRQRLSVNSEILENKKVVVWQFTERDVGLGRQGWQPVPLPSKL